MILNVIDGAKKFLVTPGCFWKFLVNPVCCWKKLDATKGNRMMPKRLIVAEGYWSQLEGHEGTIIIQNDAECC